MLFLADCVSGTGNTGAATGQRTDFFLGFELKPVGGRTIKFGHYPLQVGNAWTYRNVYKSAIGGSDAIITVTWLSVETIRAHVEIPEGRMIVRDCTVEDVQYDYPADVKESDVSWFKDNIGKPDCPLYLLFASGYAMEIPEWGWDDSGQTLAPTMVERLNHPDDPSWQLDLAALVRGEIPKPSPTGYWTWMSVGSESVVTPLGTMEDAVHLVWRANNGRINRWFRDGVGYVKEQFRHGGSYYETDRILVDFNAPDMIPRRTRSTGKQMSRTSHSQRPPVSGWANRCDIR
jgi:hypothetical protein